MCNMCNNNLFIAVLLSIEMMWDYRCHYAHGLPASINYQVGVKGKYNV